VVVKNNKTIERKNIVVGVGTIMTQFPRINETFSAVSIDDVKKFIKDFLPKLESKIHTTICTGGELNYMRLMHYPLQKNKLFTDADHPFVITIKNYAKKNAEVFEKISLSDLEAVMPDNPTWMHGARACSAFTQAICEVYGIKTVIPSDANLINGIVRKDFTL